MKRRVSGTGSRDPKVYALAVLTAALVAALVLLSEIEEADWLLWANGALTVYFVLSVLYLLRAFRKQLRVNPYSYNTIFYAGFALFILSLAVTHGYAFALCLGNPGRFDTRQVLFTLLHSAKNYMFLTSPLLIGFSVALFLSNVSLIRHEGRRSVNVLGIILALLLVFGEAGIGLLDFWTSESERRMVLPVIIVNLFAAMYLYFECMMIGTIVANLIVLRRVPDRDRDFLIVLGCGIRRDGTPTPLLKGRLDLALDFYHRQIAETGKIPRFVVSGGQGPDEPRSEAAAMGEYLLSRGVPGDRILTEDRSRDTAENMGFSARIIRSLQPEGKIAYFTTNYHVFRAGIKARQADLPAEGMGAGTKWYFWPNAAVREFIGLLTEHRGTQLVILAGLIAAYTALTVLALG